MQAIYQTFFQEKEINELLQFNWIDYKIPKDEKNKVDIILTWVLKNKDFLGMLIKDYSHNWDISRISLVTKSILMLSIFQLQEQGDTIPGVVVIDEAVRLAKEYAEDDASKFINGILDSYYKTLPKKHVRLN